MAIKERKQITGAEAQIKGYAGHNGVLAYATDTKHLHVLSGTAGTTTKLANMSDIPAPVDISGKADKTYVDTELAGKANSPHTHTKDQITDFPTIPDAILKNGDRGAIAGYEQWTKVGATTTLTVSSGDALLMEAEGAAVTITLQGGAVGQVATKLVWVYLSNKSITINGATGCFGEVAPTLNKNNAVFLFFFHDLYVEWRLLGQWDEL